MLIKGDSMAQFTKMFECSNCGSEGILSYESEFGEPIFCPFCSEELIEEDELDNLRSLEDDDDEDEEDFYSEESPIDEMIMDIDVD